MIKSKFQNNLTFTNTIVNQHTLPFNKTSQKQSKYLSLLLKKLELSIQSQFSQNLKIICQTIIRFYKILSYLGQPKQFIQNLEQFKQLLGSIHIKNQDKSHRVIYYFIRKFSQKMLKIVMVKPSLQQYQHKFKIRLPQNLQIQQDLLFCKTNPSKINSRLHQVLQAKYQPPNPICIGCSIFHTKLVNLLVSDELPHKFLTINQGNCFQETGQLCIFVQGQSNAQIHNQLMMAMLVCLSTGGGYVIIHENSGNILNGLTLSNKQLIKLFKIIQSVYNTIQPVHAKPEVDVKLRYIHSSPCQASKYNCSKYILLLNLIPRYANIFYSEIKIQENKSIIYIFDIKAGKIVQVNGFIMYSMIINTYYTHRNRKTNKFLCLPCVKTCAPLKTILSQYMKVDLQALCPVSNKIVDININKKNLNQENQHIKSSKFDLLDPVEQMYLIFDEQSQAPIVKYKNFAIILIAKKSESGILKRLESILKYNKIPATIRRPYKKIALTTEHSIYTISFECSLDKILNFHRESDKAGKSYLIFYTQCLQIQGFLSKNNKDRLKMAFKKQFDKQIEFKFEWVLIPNKKQQKKVEYLSPYNEIEATFLFVYINEMGYRCKFIKESGK